jgi:hypothetical protein
MLDSLPHGAEPSELLYLIYQYFQSCPGLNSTAQALRADLVSDKKISSAMTAIK